MHRYYFLVVFVLYSAPLIVDSIPIRKDAVIQRPRSSMERIPPDHPNPYSTPDHQNPYSTPNHQNPYSTHGIFFPPLWLQWLVIVLQVLLAGLLAGTALAVMTPDKTRLRVWMKTGAERQRSILHLHMSICETNNL